MTLRSGKLVEQSENHQKFQEHDPQTGHLLWSDIRWHESGKPTQLIGRHVEEFRRNGTLCTVTDLDIEKGFLKKTEFYEDGKTRREYSEERRPPDQRYFAVHGPQMVWDEDGDLCKLEIFEDGCRLSSEVFYKNGMPESYEEFVENGKEPTLVDRFAGNGQLMSRIYLHNNEPVTTLAFEVTGRLKPGTVYRQMHRIPYEMFQRIEIETQIAEEKGAEGLQQIRRVTAANKLEV